MPDARRSEDLTIPAAGGTRSRAWEGERRSARLLRAGGLLLALALLGVPRAEAGCLSDGGGAGFILVKTTFNSYISVAMPSTCTEDPNAEIYSFSMTFQGFLADPPVTIWSGSGDPNTHTANPLTTFPPSNQDADINLEAPFRIQTFSLADLGVYSYLFQGTSGHLVLLGYDSNGNPVYDYYTQPMTSDTLPFGIDNSPPSVNISVGGTRHVGNTLTLSSSASDPDGGSLPHFEWTVLSKPAGSSDSLSGTSSSSASLSLTDPDSIGNWQVRVRVADNEGELKEDTESFTVDNQEPNVSITGATTIDALTNVHLVCGPATDPDGETVTFTWDLTAAPPASGESPQSNWRTGSTVDFPTGPQEIGTWGFTCHGQDGHGGSDSASVSVQVLPIPPEINIPNPNRTIRVGETIFFETTILNDAYGDPMASFSWDLIQVPASAGIGLAGNYSSGSSVSVSTGASSAGTWKFRLTVTDQVGETAEEVVKVLVDDDPVAVVLGPSTTGNLSLPLDLSSTGTHDPDSPATPPDFGHLHSEPVDVSPGIVRYVWSVREVPAEYYGDYYPGPVADVLDVSGSGANLTVPANKLRPGDWLFELEVEDGEGNTATETLWVQVVEEGLPPLALVNPPAFYSTDLAGNLAVNVLLDGSASIDLDDLLTSSWGPGLGITAYQWDIIQAPPGCAAPDPADTATANLYSAGAVIAPACQGLYRAALTVTDNDTPTARQGANETQIFIGNCPGAICLDYPTTTAPEFVLFTDQTDVLILYHLNSILYDDPIFALGLRLRLEIFHESDLALPVYDRAWDVDLLPSDKGGALMMHWSGFLNGNQRPEPGRYSVALHLFDAAGNPTGYSAVQHAAIWIQTLDIAVEPATDALACRSDLVAGTDALNIAYDISGVVLLPGTHYDEIQYRIYQRGTNALVYQGSHFGPFTGSFSWNGDLGAGVFINPGDYDLELELRNAGAILGTSAPRFPFTVVETALDIHKPRVVDPAEPIIPEADELSVGSVTFVNLDNDDADTKFDDTDDVVAGGDDELVKVRLKLRPNTLTGGTVTLNAPTGAATVAAWKQNDKAAASGYAFGTPLSVPAEFTVDGDWLIKDIWIEGKTAHTAQRQAELAMTYQSGAGSCSSGEVSLTVLGVELISWIGQNNSLTHTNALDADPNKPAPVTLDFRRVFPDARVVGGAVEAAARDLVTARVQLSAATPHAVNVHLDSFDVDDPTAETGPLDDPGAGTNETVAEDNRGAAPARSGQFTGQLPNGLVALAFAAGDSQKDVDFQTTLQPGDNFRLAANADADFVLTLQNADSALNVGASADIRNNNKQRIVDPNVAGAPAAKEIRQADHYASPTLTVWRFLHVERDSMVAVPNAGAEANVVLGNVTAIAGTPLLATDVTVSAVLGDGSSDLTATAIPGRFQGGLITIGSPGGTAPQGTTLDLFGNGNDFVRDPSGIDVPFKITQAGQADVDGSVRAWAGSTFTLTISAGALTPAYVGGSISVAGVAMAVSAVNPAGSSVDVAALAPIPFHLVDDDDALLLPALPDTTFMAAKFAPAYVVPAVDGGTDPAFNKQTVDFRRNVTSGSSAALDVEYNKANAFESGASRSARFWISYVLQGYQVETNHDYDSDDNSEWGPHGVNGGGPTVERGTTMFMESLRDYVIQQALTPAQNTTLARRHVVHEVGHQFGPNDATGGIYDYGLIYNLGVDPDFLPLHLDLIRSRVTPGQ